MRANPENLRSFLSSGVSVSKYCQRSRFFFFKPCINLGPVKLITFVATWTCIFWTDTDYGYWNLGFELFSPLRYNCDLEFQHKHKSQYPRIETPFVFCILRKSFIWCFFCLSVKVMPFANLMSLLGSGTDSTAVLRCIQQVAMLVQGNWVVKRYALSLLLRCGFLL